MAVPRSLQHSNRHSILKIYCIGAGSDTNFHEKAAFVKSQDMDIIKILDNVIYSIENNNIALFKIGFVGNGEPLLDYERLS